MRKSKKKVMKIIREIESNVRVIERVESRSLSLEDTLTEEIPSEELIDLVPDKKEDFKTSLVLESLNNIGGRTDDSNREDNEKEKIREEEKNEGRVKIYGETRSAKIYGSNSESRAYSESRNEGYSSKIDGDSDRSKNDLQRKGPTLLQEERSDEYLIGKQEEERNSNLVYSPNKKKKWDQL